MSRTPGTQASGALVRYTEPPNSRTTQALFPSFVVGADAISAVQANSRTIGAQIDAHRDLSASLTIDDGG